MSAKNTPSMGDLLHAEFLTKRATVNIGNAASCEGDPKGSPHVDWVRNQIRCASDDLRHALELLGASTQLADVVEPVTVASGFIEIDPSGFEQHDRGSELAHDVGDVVIVLNGVKHSRRDRKLFCKLRIIERQFASVGQCESESLDCHQSSPSVGGCGIPQPTEGEPRSVGEPS